MINTYQTSLAPPPVPPRLSRSNPVLIPAPLPSEGHSKALIKFLVGVALLHLFLSIGGFIYLYSNRMGKFAPDGTRDYSRSDKQESFYKISARMVVELNKSPQKSAGDYLQWDMSHSVLRGINYYHKSWLTIQQPGDYFVYSKVTFSKGHPSRPLASRIKLKKNETGVEKTVMSAYCSLDSHSGSAGIPHLCTASQGEVIKLERGNQLSVWVQDLSLVDYEEESTTFGMYKL